MIKNEDASGYFLSIHNYPRNGFQDYNVFGNVTKVYALPPPPSNSLNFSI